MKKGQKVRLNDNTIATIADSTFFVMNGKKHIRYEVRSPGEREGRWVPAEELLPVKETVTVTVEDGIQTLVASLHIDWAGEEIKITITGSPENLKEHKGVHMRVMGCFIESLKTKF